ncbi:MAG: hypothetical protein JWM53_5318 [bacterium]|nr:hypothetical protein [bacterium]
MDREELGKMKLEALRLLAQERGVDGARNLGKAELIDQLAPRTIVERAKEAVAHAVEVVEGKAHDLIEAIRHPPSAEHPHAAEPDSVTQGGKRNAEGAPAHPANGFGVPSATVHHAAPLAAAQEPVGMLDFEELPETYGVDECEVLFKDPFWVFAYWEVTEGGISSARAQLGQSAQSSKLVMRMFTTVPGPEGVDRQIHDIDLPWNHGRRYMQAPKPGAHLRVAVGLLSGEGYFAPITHSSLVRVPPAEPQPGPVEWMEVVPDTTRGRQRMPLVVVRRAPHDERGVKAPEGFGAGESEPRGGSSPSAGRPGAPGFPFGGSSSSPTRRGGGN